VLSTPDQDKKLGKEGKVPKRKTGKRDENRAVLFRKGKPIHLETPIRRELDSNGSRREPMSLERQGQYHRSARDKTLTLSSERSLYSLKMRKGRKGGKKSTSLR